MYIKSHAELALHIQGFHMLRLQQLWIGNTQKKKKNTESSKKQNLNLLCMGNVIYITFTLY